jgi:hypothetical protein
MSEKIDDRFAPGTMGCHEALHMASVLADLVEAQLANHPAVLANAEWGKIANAALDSLCELYQAIGREHMK